MGNNGLEEAMVTASGPQLMRSTRSDLVHHQKTRVLTLVKDSHLLLERVNRA